MLYCSKNKTVWYSCQKVHPLTTIMRKHQKCRIKRLSTKLHECAKSLQSYPILCDPMDYSPSSSSVHRILQARILEWVAISFSNACTLSRFSRVRLYATLWTAAHQAPLSTGFSRQEYWSGLPFPSPSRPSTIALFYLLCFRH